MGSKNTTVAVICRVLWSGRRDLNPGPLAPQAININYLQGTFAENKRLSPTKFGRQLDAKAENFAFGLQWTPHQVGRKLALTRAVVIPLYGRLETTTNSSYIWDPAQSQMLGWQGRV
jgi:hypothetical protein